MGTSSVRIPLAEVVSTRWNLPSLRPSCGPQNKWYRNASVGGGFLHGAETPRLEAELRVALVSRRKAWQHQNTNRKDSQSKRAVRRTKVELKKIREAGVVSFFQRLVGEIEEKLQRRDQRGLLHLLKSTQVEEVRKLTRSTFETSRENYCKMLTSSARDGCNTSARC